MDPITAFNKAIKDAGEKGIEKSVSWLLFGVLHVFPGIYIREFMAEQKRSVWIERYVLFKFLLAFICFYFSWYTYDGIRFLLMYLALETFLYNLLFILCNNLFPPARSYKRVLILGFMNYGEIVLVFASLYAGLKLVGKAATKIDYLYFSIGTGGALNYGDYELINATGKSLAIIQCIVFIMFFILFISYNTSMFMAGRK